MTFGSSTSPAMILRFISSLSFSHFFTFASGGPKKTARKTPTETQGPRVTHHETMRKSANSFNCYEKHILLHRNSNILLEISAAPIKIQRSPQIKQAGNPPDHFASSGKDST